MHAWEAIQKTLDYIEVHLEEDIAIEALAEMAALSPFYYQRLFSRLVKKPVKEYIKLRRLSKAADMLADSSGRILDIAMACGFNSHENFTRAFKDAYGMTPEKYRKNPVYLNRFDKPDLLLRYTMADEGVPLISNGIIIEMNRKTLDEPILFLGFQGYVPIEGQIPVGEDTGVDIPGEIWREFHAKKHLLPSMPGGRELGVAFLGDAPAGSFTYFAGAESKKTANDQGFAAYALPAGGYMVCGFEAEDFNTLVTTALNKALKYTRTWLETHNLTQEVYSPEMYYDSSPEGAYMEFWIPLDTEQGKAS